MWINQKIKKEFSDKKMVCESRYEWSKLIFVIFSFVFFLSFFFVSSGFYDSFFIKYISVFYIMTVFSFSLFVYFFVLKNFQEKLNTLLKIILVLFLVILSVFFIWPIFVEWGLISLFL